MGKEFKVTIERPTCITMWTVVGDTKETDVPQNVEKHEEIGILGFYFA